MDMREFFNEKAETWDQEIPAFLPARGVIAVLGGVKTGSTVLDIACGTGIMIPEYLALGARYVTGIDLAERMIAVAKEKFARDKRVELVAEDFFSYTGGPFSVAVMYNAYPHFAQKSALLEAVARLLVPGGRFTVAHGAGRQAINAHHHSAAAQVSVGLGPATEEAALWEPWFQVDTLVDTTDLYVIAGTKRE